MRSGPARPRPRREVPAPPPPPGPPGPESRNPDLVRRGLPPPANRESRWVGDTHLHHHLGGGLDPPGDRPRAAAQRKQSGTRSGRPHAAPAPGVRGDRHGGPQVPVPRQERRSSYPGRGCQYTSEQLSQHLGRYEIIASTGRTRGARAEAGGCDPQGTRGSTRWSTTARSKATRDTASQVDPGTHNQRQPHPAPRAQDTRRARPGAPSNKTTSPRHRFQSCPRHTQQPTQPPPLPVPTGLQASERLLHPMRTSRPPVMSIRTSIYAIPRKHQLGVPRQPPQNAVLFNSGHISFLA